MLFFFCPLASVLMGRYGARAVTIAGGILMSAGLLRSSFGTCLAYLPTLVMVGRYFDKRRSLATGIATCGSNVGALSLASLQEVILKKYGWRNVFRFTAGFSLLVILCGVVFRHPVESAKSEKSRQRQGTRKRVALLMKNPTFLLWCFATTIGCFGYFIPHVHLVRMSHRVLLRVLRFFSLREKSTPKSTYHCDCAPWSDIGCMVAACGSLSKPSTWPCRPASFLYFK